MYRLLLVSLGLMFLMGEVPISAQMSQPSVRHVVWTDTNQIIAQSNEAICVYHGDDLTLERSISLATIPAEITDLVYSPVYNYLFTSHTNGIVYMWDMTTGEIVDFIYAHKGSISDIDLRGDLLATGGYDDGYMRLWDFTTQTMLFEFDEFLHFPLVKLTISPTENSIVFIKGGVLIWHYETDEYGLLINAYDDIYPIFREISFSPNQQWVFSTGWGRSIFWHVEARVPQTKNVKQIENIMLDTDFHYQMEKLALLEGGLLVVYATEVDGESLTIGDVIFTYDTRAMQVFFSPVDDHLLLIEGAALIILDSSNGQHQQTITMCRP